MKYKDFIILLFPWFSILLLSILAVDSYAGSFVAFIVVVIIISFPSPSAPLISSKAGMQLFLLCIIPLFIWGMVVAFTGQYLLSGFKIILYGGILILIPVVVLTKVSTISIIYLFQSVRLGHYGRAIIAGLERTLLRAPLWFNEANEVNLIRRKNTFAQKNFTYKRPFLIIMDVLGMVVLSAVKVINEILKAKGFWENAYCHGSIDYPYSSSNFIYMLVPVVFCGYYFAKTLYV